MSEDREVLGEVWVVFLVPFLALFLSFFYAKIQFLARLGGLFE